MAHSTRPKADDKAAILAAARKHKAKDKIPLLAHATMRWGRKINGRLHYFGKVDPALPDYGSGAALAEYHRTVDDLRAGRQPRPKDDDLVTLRDAANQFLEAKADLRDSGELSARVWSHYHRNCARIIDVLGKHRAVADLKPADFRRLRAAFAKGRGPVALRNEVKQARILFKFCYDERLIDRPVQYGQAFDVPSRKTLRIARAARGLRMFEADELRTLMDAADPIMKAMILLAANCGYGQTDLARLPQSAVNFKTGWIDFPRPKTGIPRKCPLWRETIAAVQDAIAVRPEPKDPDDADLVFITDRGLRVVRDQTSRKDANSTNHVDAVAALFGRLMKDVGINGQRNFYAIRHGFETVAGETADQVAVNSIMGHVDETMAGLYRERIDADRLQKVVDHVHQWLFGSGDNG